MSFYVHRDTNPEGWYPLDADGVVQKLDDLAPEYARNVNTTEVPYNPRAERPVRALRERDRRCGRFSANAY